MYIFSPRGKYSYMGIIRSGFDSEIFFCNSLVDMYTECGKVDDAHMIFDKIAFKKCGRVNSMIVDFSQNDLCK